jgi:hypothetical protein
MGVATSPKRLAEPARPTWRATTAYAKARNVAIMAMGKVANRDFLYRRDRAEAWMADLAALGIRGAKIDFFEQRDSTATATDDYEDTQARLQLRDFLSETAAKYHLMVEYHGAGDPLGRTPAVAEPRQRRGGVRAGAPRTEPPARPDDSPMCETSWGP